jgi:hypothetical protein
LYNHTEIFHQLDCVLLSEFSLIENQSDKIYPADHVVDQFVISLKIFSTGSLRIKRVTIGSNLACSTSEHLDVAHGDHGANEIGGESGSVGLQLGIRCQKSQTHL